MFLPVSLQTIFFSRDLSILFNLSSLLSGISSWRSYMVLGNALAVCSLSFVAIGLYLGVEKGTDVFTVDTVKTG